MAFTSIGCISASPVFATQQWPAGIKALGPIALPDKFRSGMILVDVSQVNDLLAKISVVVELSMDGGTTFVPVRSFAIDLPNSGYSLNPGLVDANGNPVRIAGIDMSFPQPISLTRQVRGTASLSQPAFVGMTIVIW